jgi:RNase P/RNase MRP subunit p30
METSNYIKITEENFQKARNEIKKAREIGKKIIYSGSDEMNRKILEKEKIDILLIKLSDRKDKIKQRNSGFNHVLAILAQKKYVTIGVDLDEIIFSDKKQKAKILSRLMQNIEFCKKNKLKMIFIGISQIRNIYDLRALGLVLRMPTKMTSSLEFQKGF